MFGYMVSQEIAEPITLLANAADQFGNGNLSARADVRSKDEIGDLATAFNRMAASLESYIEQPEQVDDTLLESDCALQERIADLEDAQHA